METKICNKCGREFPATKGYFYTHPRGKYGLNGKCKECFGFKFDIDKPKQRDGYKKCTSCGKELEINSENFYKEKRSSTGYASCCKKCYLKKCSKFHKKKYQENIIKFREKAKKFREENKERIKKYNKKYASKPKARAIRNINTIKYRSKKKELDSKYNLKDWNKAKKFFNNRCAYCEKEEKLTQEHFIPLSKGGEYTVNNIIPACQSCNSSKGNKDFFKWYKNYEFYSEERENKILKYLGYKENKQQLKLI